MTPATVTVAPFGSWASPFKIERLTDRVVFLSEARGDRRRPLVARGPAGRGRHGRCWSGGTSTAR